MRQPLQTLQLGRVANGVTGRSTPCNGIVLRDPVIGPNHPLRGPPPALSGPVAPPPNGGRP
eukprot:3236141-Lingulodinium_polyedra.AAC.1